MHKLTGYMKWVGYVSTPLRSSK